MSINPTASTILLGTTQQLAATGTLSDGSTQDLNKSASWQSTNTAVATVSSTGLVTAVAPGTATIRATLNTTSASTAVTVGGQFTGSWQNVGATPIGSTGSAALFYSLPSATTNFSLSYGLEFTAGTPTCSGSGPVTCGIPVTFKPKYAGRRTDAIVVKDGSGNILRTTYLSGLGTGPQTALLPGLFTSLAGIGLTGYSGDGGPATSAMFGWAMGVAVDPRGNLYIADFNNNRVRKVDTSTGVITTVVGDGTAGYSGDGGPAASAWLNSPAFVQFDANGNLYIADLNNNRIRKVDASTGVITTVAGNGTQAYSGDGGPATSASLNHPEGMAFDSVGNLYFADTLNNVVRKVDASTGVITSAVGSGGWGYGGDGGPATAALLQSPTGVTIDSADNLYLAEANGNHIRKVDASTGVITTVAGNGTFGYSGDGGPATSAAFNEPHGLAVDAAGNLYIADTFNFVIRKVDAATGVITTMVGGGTWRYGVGSVAATTAQLSQPIGVAVDGAGSLYIGDYDHVPTVSTSAAPLTFADTGIGSTSAVQSVSLANIGNAALHLSNIAASTNFTLDSGTTTCSISSAIVAGASCTAGVTFTPSVAGSLTGTLTITDDALNSTNSQQVQLSGTGF